MKGLTMYIVLNLIILINAKGICVMKAKGICKMTLTIAIGNGLTVNVYIQTRTVS